MRTNFGAQSFEFEEVECKDAEFDCAHEERPQAPRECIHRARNRNTVCTEGAVLRTDAEEGEVDGGVGVRRNR